MNKQGTQFIDKVSQGFKEIDTSEFSIDESQITERVMRLGTEARVYELDCPGIGNTYITTDLREMAMATLKEDYIKDLICTPTQQNV